VKQRKAMIESDCPLSVRRQCQLLEVNRNRLVPSPPKLIGEDAALCRLIDEIHMEDPAFGARKIRDVLRRHYGIDAGRARVARLMRHMGVTAVYRRPRTSLPGKGEEHRIYPYLLGDGVAGPDEAWCADITYLPVGRGFAYLVAVMDWHTRAVLSWKLSNTLDTAFWFGVRERFSVFRNSSPALQSRAHGTTSTPPEPTGSACNFNPSAWITFRIVSKAGARSPERAL